MAPDKGPSHPYYLRYDKITQHDTIFRRIFLLRKMLHLKQTFSFPLSSPVDFFLALAFFGPMVLTYSHTSLAVEGAHQPVREINVQREKRVQHRSSAAHGGQYHNVMSLTVSEFRFRHFGARRRAPTNNHKFATDLRSRVRPLRGERNVRSNIQAPSLSWCAALVVFRHGRDGR